MCYVLRIPMQTVLSGFLAPSVTTPLRWDSNSKKRSAREQVLSGLQIAFGLVAIIVVLALAFRSISALVSDPAQSGALKPSFAWTLLISVAFIMFATASHWARFFSLVFCTIVFRAAVAILIGRIPLSSFIPRGLTRPEAFLVFLTCGIAVALAWRFVDAHPPPTTFLDRLSLTYFLLVFDLHLLVGARWTLIILVSALASLASSWSFYRSRGRARKNISRVYLA